MSLLILTVNLVNDHATYARVSYVFVIDLNEEKKMARPRMMLCEEKSKKLSFDLVAKLCET